MDLHQSLNTLDRILIEQRGKRLEPLEREILGVAWDNESYRKIESYQEQTVKNRAIKLWRYLSELLRTKVNKHNLRQILAGLDIGHISPAALDTSVNLHCISKFYGRLTELWQLQQWIESDPHQLIFLHGMKGIGKTTLIRKLTEYLAPKLDHVIWISLATAPPLIEILPIIIKAIGDGRNAKLPKNTQAAIDKTIGYLQTTRCLLVFDNADLVLSQAEGSNPNLFQDYAQFFAQLNFLDGDIFCLTITTEKCAKIGSDDRQLELQGLDRSSCQDLLHPSELVGTIAEWDTLINLYQGNPQYLKIVANTITDIFAGKIDKFLDANILVYQPIETLLAQQLDLLSNAEMSILLWLAIEREPINLAQLQSFTSVSISGSDTVKILDRLVRKYLVEVHDDLFTLSELIMESITRRYHQLVCEGITTKKLKILHLYPIIPLAKSLKNDKNCTDNQVDKIHQDIKYHLQSIISRLLSREHFTTPRSEILASMLFPSLQQKTKLKQDLKAELSDLLIQLDPIEHQYIYDSETQLASRDRPERGKMPSYAVENLTNLLAGIDQELVS